MFNSRGNSGMLQLTPAVKYLLVINFAVWLLMIVSSGFANFANNHLGLHLVGARDFNPVQFVTYMFIHSNTNFLHIFFNMFTLWMFGRLLEQVWGTKRFVIFYFIAGIGAAVVQEGVWLATWHSELVDRLAHINGLTISSAAESLNMAIANHDAHALDLVNGFKNSMVTVGASGAIFGLLLGFAFVFPNLPLYLFFIPIPIKAKYMVAGYAVLEFFLGVGNADSTVAHFAHLGGMIFALIPLLIWWKNGTLRGNRY